MTIECSSLSGTPMTPFPNPREHFRVWSERTVGTRGLGRSTVFCIWCRRCNPEYRASGTTCTKQSSKEGWKEGGKKGWNEGGREGRKERRKREKGKKEWREGEIKLGVELVGKNKGVCRNFRGLRDGWDKRDSNYCFMHKITKKIFKKVTFTHKYSALEMKAILPL